MQSVVTGQAPITLEPKITSVRWHGIALYGLLRLLRCSPYFCRGFVTAAELVSP